MVEDSNSDSQQEFVGKKYLQSSESEDDDQEQPCADKVITSKRKQSKKILPRLPEFIPSSDLKNPTF